jgi:hypothetical protein
VLLNEIRAEVSKVFNKAFVLVETREDASAHAMHQLCKKGGEKKKVMT